MRFIITAGPGDTKHEADPNAPFDEKLFDAYMRFNEEMHQAGVLVASEGLNPAGGRARVVASGGKRVAVDGPFAESKELLGGFYLIDVKSKEEAIAWALRAPCGMGFDDVLDIHQMTDIGDIPPALQERIKAAAPTWSASWAAKRG